MKFYTLILVIFCFTISCKNEPESNQNLNTQAENAEPVTKELRHVVLFKFKDSASKEDIKKAEDAFEALPSKMPGITGFQWGLNNSPQGLNKGFTHCYYITFDGEKGREIYIPHPAHVAFGDLLKPILEDVLVIDYWDK